MSDIVPEIAVGIMILAIILVILGPPSHMGGN